MYCNSCGSPIGSGETVCSRCGTSVIGARAAVAAKTRVAGNVELVAIFWYVMAVFSLIPAIVMLALSGVIGAMLQHEEIMEKALASGLFTLLAVVFAAHALVAFLTGWGLQKLRPWGRTLAIVMAFLALIHPPIGTALGIYTLVVLLPEAAGEEYRRMSSEGEQAFRAKSA